MMIVCLFVGWTVVSQTKHAQDNHDYKLWTNSKYKFWILRMLNRTIFIVVVVVMIMI